MAAMNGLRTTIIAVGLLAAMLPALLPAQAGSSDSAVRTALRDELFARLRSAGDENAARRIERKIWAFWSIGPDDEATALMKAAHRARRSYNFNKTLQLLNQVIKRWPAYSEGWNQRATVLFLKQEYDRSLDDIEKVLVLEPNHFGALAGKAVILMRQGRPRLSQKALRRAVKIHPYLRERRMLLPVPKSKDGLPL